MIVFKPRLAMFYIIVLAVIAILTNKLTISSQQAVANTTNPTNVESSK